IHFLPCVRRGRGSLNGCLDIRPRWNQSTLGVVSCRFGRTPEPCADNFDSDALKRGTGASAGVRSPRFFVRSLCAVLAAVLCATACSTDRTPGDPPAQPKAVRMGTVTLSRDNEPAKYSAILTPNAQVDLAFRVSGYVVELYQTIGADGRMRPLEPGAQVAAGTVLARVRPSDYQAVADKARGAQQEAEAGVAAAEAQLVQAQASLA